MFVILQEDTCDDFLEEFRVCGGQDGRKEEAVEGGQFATISHCRALVVTVDTAFYVHVDDHCVKADHDVEEAWELEEELQAIVEDVMLPDTLRRQES